MPRANKYHLPGYILLVTHRCHKMEFLMKYPEEKLCWIKWLNESKRRFGLEVYNYMVSSNHIHLLAFDNNEGSVSRSMHLIAGCTAQGYNSCKNRVGAFWSDRYHATIIEKGIPLLDCLVYIDLNMVRAGAVIHPSQWNYGGYHEIFAETQQLNIINIERLSYHCGFSDVEEFKKEYQKRIGAKLSENKFEREPVWTENVAVGSQNFVSEVKERLGIRSNKRYVVKVGGIYILKEPEYNSYR